MTRPVYIWVESGGTQLTERPRVRQTQFGDGYLQRQADGLNPIAQAWQIRHTAIDNDAADEIVTFLRARGGVEAFDYTPLWHTTARLFIATDWARTASSEPGYSDIMVNVQEVFEP